ncbi:MAG: beta-propeller fold lactonase family protein, partial [Solirubrobacteraceae bacterium]
GGALSPLSSPEVTSGSGPLAIAVSPDGTSVYVANNSENSVSHFSVEASGALSLKGSIPTLNPAAGSQARGVAVGSGPTSEGEPPVKTNQQPSTSGPSAGSSSSSAGSTPGIASTPQAIEEVLLGCSKRQLVLNDAFIHGGRVALSGSAAKSLAGKKVKILFNEGRQVASATIGANGQFATTAPLPPAKIRESLTTRYSAEVGRLRSLHLKLTRRLQLEPPKASGTTVTLEGLVTPPLTMPITPVVVEQQLECGKTTIAKTFTPPASGRFHITVTVPAGARAGIFTLKSKVAANKHATAHGFTTYSLPLPVALG